MLRALLLVLVGCSLHHRVERAPVDAGFDGLDARPDAVAPDVFAPDAGPMDLDLVLGDDQPYRLFGARHGERLALVIGERRLFDSACDCFSTPPITIFEVRSGDAPELELRAILDDTGGAEPGEVARHLDTVAVAFKPLDAPPELALVDSNTGAVTWRALIPEISPTYNLFAFMAMNADHLLLVYDTDRAMFGRLYRREGGGLAFERSVYEGPRGSPELASVASRIEDPDVQALLVDVFGARAVDLARASTSSIARADHNVFVDIEFGELLIDGVTRDTLDGSSFTSSHGTDLSIFEDAGLFAIATGSGLRWVTWIGDAPGQWRQPASIRFLGAFPVAYRTEAHAGVFFIDPALGSSPSELRYVGTVL